MTPGRPIGRIGIGEVIRRLRPEFPDLTISKIRFLETEGLLYPERSDSGYRKFSPADVARLRYILSAQRDQYLPLKVIGEHLDAMDRGLEPPAAAGEAPRVPAAPGAGRDPVLRSVPEVALTRRELLSNSGLADEQLRGLESYGLAAADRDGHFDGYALGVARAAAVLARHGLEPRHLRMVKTSADRQAALVDQVIAPIERHRDQRVSERATAVRRQLIDAIAELHTLLLTQAGNASE